MHYRPVRHLPPERACHELNLGPAPRKPTLGLVSDRALAWYAGRSFQPGRERALAYAERWIIDRQELDGSWGGIQPPWVWSLIALACRGHGPDSPYLSRGLAGWSRFLVEDGDRLRPEACQSPVWDTGLALLALRAAGVPADEPALHRAGEWLVAEEIRQRGDWAVRRPGLEPGAGRSSTTTTSIRTSTTRRSWSLALDELGIGRAADRAREPLAGRACSARNGGWGAFDVDNDAEWLYKIPFCDFGAVIDPP